MSKARRDQLVLGVLLAILAVAVWNVWGHLGNRAVAPEVPAESVEPPAPGVDTERFSSLAISSDWAEGIGERGAEGRDPFQYGGIASPPPAASPPPPPVPDAAFVRPAPTPPAPPPAPLPIEYVGFSRVGGAGALLRAVLMGPDGLPYPALSGETVLGRYRVDEVTEEYVVVEDLESGRRERLPARIAK